MKNFQCAILTVFICSLLFTSCNRSFKELSVKSPDNEINMIIHIDDTSQLVYSMYHNNIAIIKSSLPKL